MGHAHLSANSTGVTLQSLQKKGFIGIIAYVIATVLSLFLPALAFLVCLVLAMYYVFGVEDEAVSEEASRESHT